MGVDEPGLPTLYEWAGGLDALRRMIDAFSDRVEQDDALTGFFPGGVSERHRAHVTDWWAEVLGGPTQVVEHAPTPRWGWGVAPPYQGSDGRSAG